MHDSLIDVTRLVTRLLQGRLPTGVDRVALEYVRHFGPSARALLRKGRFSGVLSWRASQRLFAQLLAGPPVRPRRLRFLIASSPPLPLTAGSAAGALLFNLGHSGLERPGYADWVRRKGCRPVYMVHDLIPITHAEYCRPGEDRRHVARMRTALQTAHALVTNSQATLRELAAFADAAGLPLPPTVCAPLAPCALPPAAPAPPLPFPYFVLVGTIEPRKNHLLILQLWRRLAESYGDQAPRLVVIGQRGWECENIVDLLERCSALQPYVLERANCSDLELAAYLRHARALLFPSFAEGFGLPAAEAIAAGTPVIASDLPVFREILGGVPDYLDPLDGLGWLETILAYADPADGRRAAQLQRLQHCPLPSWPEHFVRVEALLQEAALVARRYERLPGQLRTA